MCLDKSHPNHYRCEGPSNASRRARRAANNHYRNRLADTLAAGGHDDLADRVRTASFSSMTLITEATGHHPIELVGMHARVPGRSANRRISDADAELINDVGAALGTGAHYNPDTDSIDVVAEERDHTAHNIAMMAYLANTDNGTADLPRDPDPVAQKWDPYELPPAIAAKCGRTILADAKDVGVGEPGCDDHARAVIADADPYLRRHQPHPADDLVDAPGYATRQDLWEAAEHLEATMEEPADGDAAAGMAHAAQIAERDFIVAMERDLDTTIGMTRHRDSVHARGQEGAVYSNMPVGADDDREFRRAVEKMDAAELADACARYTLTASRMNGLSRVMDSHTTPMRGKLPADAVADRARLVDTYADVLQHEVCRRSHNRDDAKAMRRVMDKAVGSSRRATAPGTADAVRKLRYYGTQMKSGPVGALAHRDVALTAAEAARAGLDGQFADHLEPYDDEYRPLAVNVRPGTDSRPGPRRWNPHTHGN